MNIAAWIIFGGLTGLVASVIDPEENSLLGSVVIGMLGSMLGGFLANLIWDTGVTGFSLGSLIMAIISSSAVLIAQRFFVKKDENY